MCTEADRMEEMYDDYEGMMDYQRYVIERDFGIANINSIDIPTCSRRNKRRLNKKEKGLFIIIQDSRKDDTTLMLVDRRKSKKYWWTHDFSLVYKGKKEEMEKVASRLHKNNARIVNFQEYFNTL